MLKQLFARHVARRGLIGSRRQRAGTRYQMLGETLEPRSMFAVSASLSAGTLNITLGAAGDAAFLSITGSSYAVTDGTGAAVSGSPFTGVTAAVSVAGTVAANQSFTFNGSTALPVSLSVDSSMESATISQAINATSLSGSTVSLSSAAITLAADISTEGAQKYVNPVQLLGSPSLTSTTAAVTFDRGVSNVNTTFAPQTTFATGSRSPSVSIGDFNGDGRPDLAIANYDSASVSVLLNTTAPGATMPSYAAQTAFATGSVPRSIAIGDLNGDGKPDLAIANRGSNSVSVLLNTTAPGATTPSYAAQATFATGGLPYSVSIGDLNGDGKPDLAIANYGSNSVSVLLNTTAPGATAPSYASQATFAAGSSPGFVSIADLNGDGRPDLAIANQNSNSVSVLLSTTAPGATAPSYAAQTTFATGTKPVSVSIGDLNGDGKPDLVIANTSSNSVSVLLSTTAPGATIPSYAAQTTFAAGTDPRSVSIGDLNGDGKPDLAIANYNSNSVSVLLNTTAPGATIPSYATQATFATGTTPISVSIGDLNGDGKPDLATANAVSNSLSVLLNTTAPGATTPSYAAQTTFATGSSPRSIAIGDLNGDGKPDLAVANLASGTGSVSVLLNATSTGNLTVSSATGTTLAGAGLGVPLGSVTITSGPTTIKNHVTTTGSQTYTGAVTLTVSVTTLTGTTITTASTVTGNSTKLLIAGNAVVGGAVTGLTTYSVSGTTSLAADVTTTGTQTYTGAVTLAADTTLTGTTPTFTTGVAGNSKNLTLNFSGTTTIDGAQFTGIKDLATGNGGTTLLTGTITTTGAQTYTGLVTLAANTTLTGTAPTFTAGVAGNSQSLTLNFSGTTTIDGATFTGIKDLATGNGGTTTLTGAITTTGAQTYADAVTLAGSPSLTSTTATVSFQSTVDTYVGVGFSPQTTFATESNPFSVATADFNGDGKPDLAIANAGSNSVSVLLNTTATGATTPSYGTQTPFATGGYPQSVAIGDFNGDGKPDLAIANQVSNSVSVLLNTTAPGATTPSYATQTTFATGTRPCSLATGDLNGDGKPDLAIANGDSNSVSVLLNTTVLNASTPSYAAQTTFATGTGPSSVAIGNMNGDGKPDLAIANNNSDSVSVLLSTTALAATTPSYANQATFHTGSNPVSVAIGDLNGDGKPDLVANYGSNAVVVLLNTTAPFATTPSYTAPTRFAAGLGASFVSIGDMNGDGKPDLVIVNRDSSSVSVLLNTTSPGATTPSYAAQTTFATGSSPRSVAIGDLNGDGKPDLATANFGSDSVSVLMNTTTTGNLTVSSSTGTTFAAAVGGTTPLTSLTIASGPTSLGGSVTTTGSQSYGGAVTLTADTTLSGSAASDVALAFKGTVNGAKNMNVLGGTGTIAFDQAVGGTTPLASLQVLSGTGLTAAGPLKLDGSVPGARGNGLVIAAGVNNVSMQAAGSSIKNFSNNGIVLKGTQNSTLSGFTVTGNSSKGIQLAAGDYTGTKIVGNTITGGSAMTYGIFLSSAQNLQVGGTSIGQGNTVTGTSYGLYATGTLTGTTVAGNTISSNGLGIWLSAATSLTVNGANQLTSNKNFGLYADGTNTGTVFQGNTISGNSTTTYGTYLNGAQSLKVGGTGGGQGNTITDTGYGLYATGTLTGTTVAGNTISSSGLGIWLSAATSLTINGANQLTGNKNFGLYADRTNTGTVFQGNTVNGSSTTVFGVFLTGAQSLQVGGTVSGQANTITATGYGLYAGGTLTGTTVAGNTVSANGTGMWMSGAQGVTVNGGNQFTSNTNYGLYATSTTRGTPSTFQGNTISGGSTTKYGVLLTGAQDLQVGGAVSGQGNTITATGYGLYAGGTLTGTTVVGNTLSSNGTGIWLSAAQSLTINGANQLTTNTTYGLYATGVNTGTVFQGNTVNGNSTTTYGVFLAGAQSLQVGGPFFDEANTVTNASYGLYASGTLTGTTVAGNTLSTNGTGIWLNAATGLTINGANQLTKNTTFGFYATGVNTNTVFQGNTVDGSSTTTYGVFLTAAQGLKVGGTTTGQDNTITNTSYGLYAGGTLTGTTVAANTIQSNNTGLYLDAAQGITINNTNRVITNKVFGLFARGVSTGTTVTGNTISGNGTNISTAGASGGTFQTS